jgi:hypothetical protein
MCCVQMNYVDVNVLFMNIVNVYLCILYCPGFEFSSLELVISYFCKKKSDFRLIYDSWGWIIVD